MNNREDSFRAYRPVGPPPDLRARIMRDAESTHVFSVREWLPALATAALIVLFYALASGVRQRIEMQIPDQGDPPQIEVALQ
jgi:hypothetical protein